MRHDEAELVLGRVVAGHAVAVQRGDGGLGVLRRAQLATRGEHDGRGGGGKSVQGHVSENRAASQTVSK